VRFLHLLRVRDIEGPPRMRRDAGCRDLPRGFAVSRSRSVQHVGAAGFNLEFVEHEPGYAAAIEDIQRRLAAGEPWTASAPPGILMPEHASPRAGCRSRCGFQRLGERSSRQESGRRAARRKPLRGTTSGSPRQAQQPVSPATPPLAATRCREPCVVSEVASSRAGYRKRRVQSRGDSSRNPSSQ